MKLMKKEKISLMFTMGQSDAGFIAYKEHPYDTVLTVYIRYPNGAQYYLGNEVIVRTPSSGRKSL